MVTIGFNQSPCPPQKKQSFWFGWHFTQKNPVIYIYISGWWLSHPSETYESQLGLLFSTEWKNKKMFQTTNQYIHTYDIPQKWLVLVWMHPSFGWGTPGIQGTHRALGVLSAWATRWVGFKQERCRLNRHWLILPPKNCRNVIYHNYLSSKLLFYRKLRNDMGRVSSISWPTSWEPGCR